MCPRPSPRRTSVTRPVPSTLTVSPVTSVTRAAARTDPLAAPADRSADGPAAAGATAVAVSPTTASRAGIPYAAPRAVSLFPLRSCLFRKVLSRFPIGRWMVRAGPACAGARGGPGLHGGRVSRGRL
ncbi:hypothetical protein SGFS_089930 [Streptomyces graminofaciens]|uniref:Uncharacterized protein n=1 Tax=Streptomyces graminofaciens TaxID=68212 RepID=A0ABN5VW48_9ACTN|nr:hypothetical protein SGFS_089930 [Streptomyces graminofaciens]